MFLFLILIGSSYALSNNYNIKFRTPQRRPRCKSILFSNNYDNKFRTAFGNFDEAFYSSVSNTYRWKDVNMNMLPIENNKVKLLKYIWELSEVENDYNTYEDYYNFNYIIENKSYKFYKWINQKYINLIKCVIAIEKDSINKKIYIIKILPNPFIDFFNFDDFVDEIGQLKLIYKDYEINYDKLNLI